MGSEWSFLTGLPARCIGRKTTLTPFPHFLSVNSLSDPLSDQAHTSPITKHLIAEIRDQFRITWDGHHGAPHWARVRHHGLYLGRQLGADLRVLELFAFLHDSQRQNEYTDHGHGSRASAYAATLRERGVFTLDDAAFELLTTACNGHSDGHMVGDITVQVYWDSDRLDLGRVNIKPDARRLCTQQARDPDYIEKAWTWGLAQYNDLRAVRFPGFPEESAL
jgi:uncharacterized protein